MSRFKVTISDYHCMNEFRTHLNDEPGLLSEHCAAIAATGINNSTTGAEAHLPFGGVKGSGNGTRESGIWVIEAYSYWHAVNDELSGKLQLAQMDVEEVEMAEAEVDWTALA